MPKVKKKQIKFFLLLCFILDQGQSNVRELKNENHLLKDYVHRLNAALSEYQAMRPLDAGNVCKTFLRRVELHSFF